MAGQQRPGRGVLPHHGQRPEHRRDQDRTWHGQHGRADAIEQAPDHRAEQAHDEAAGQQQQAGLQRIEPNHVLGVDG